MSGKIYVHRSSSEACKVIFRSVIKSENSGEPSSLSFHVHPFVVLLELSVIRRLKVGVHIYVAVYSLKGLFVGDIFKRNKQNHPFLFPLCEVFLFLLCIPDFSFP